MHKFLHRFMPPTPTSLTGTVQAHRFLLLLRHNLSPNAASFPAKLNESVQGHRVSAMTRIATRRGWNMLVNVGHINQGLLHHQDPTEERAILFDTTLRKTWKVKGLKTDKLMEGLVDATNVALASSDPVEASSNAVELDDIFEDELFRGTVQPVEELSETHIFVCTHGSRDCRCGETGGAVLEELHRHLAQNERTRVRANEIAHVGQHKFAANVLLYPTGDWFGLITASHVPSLLQYAHHVAALNGLSESLPPPPPELVPHWRGGRGLNKAGQLAAIAQWRDDIENSGRQLPVLQA
ncbi:Sucrase/ferredoxin-like-domain-containing protein [Auriculariales sp. MPI-PUGE-AT-0066]|nr:Sucrase/ferredoxin-like-domain-containing protein [Auriculariales sp. MPI-PUGE-AT-0066]